MSVMWFTGREVGDAEGLGAGKQVHSPEGELDEDLHSRR